MSADVNADLEALRASLAATLTDRHVRRGVVDPAEVPRTDLLDGVVCLVADGGGQFANYLGREGQLGRLKVMLVCFVVVAENAPAVEVERAELALLADLLGWVRYPSLVQQGWAVLPQAWRCSQQLERPYGWLVLELEVRMG